MRLAPASWITCRSVSTTATCNVVRDRSTWVEGNSLQVYWFFLGPVCGKGCTAAMLNIGLYLQVSVDTKRSITNGMAHLQSINNMRKVYMLLFVFICWWVFSCRILDIRYYFYFALGLSTIDSLLLCASILNVGFEGPTAILSAAWRTTRRSVSVEL